MNSRSFRNCFAPLNGRGAGPFLWEDGSKYGVSVQVSESLLRGMMIYATDQERQDFIDSLHTAARVGMWTQA